MTPAHRWRMDDPQPKAISLASGTTPALRS
jgi:hypothetical protein